MWRGWQRAAPAASAASWPDPSPSSGSTTFTSVNGNEWWVQVKVSPTPNAVEAMDTNGAWTPLALKSWGDWAASVHVEPGHQVKFRAAHGGTWTESCWMSHPQGVAQCGSTPPPPPAGGGSFTATFKNARGNEWWIETDVTTGGGTLAGVDARVNGGTWTALDLRSYGSWAKSIHAASGSTVEFRARATSGESVVSGPTGWPPS